MKKAYAALSYAVVLAAVPAFAQTAAVSPIAAPAAGSAVLRTGTPLPLKMAEALTTKNKATKVGQRVRLEVAENVLVDGRVVIPAGSPAMGEVTDVKNKGMWGKSGKINARVLYVTINGRQIRASGQFDDKGKSGTAGVVGAAVLLPVAGFFVTGTSAQIALGAPVNGFVDEDVPLSFASSGSAPLQVQSASPTMAVPATSAAPTAASNIK